MDEEGISYPIPLFSLPPREKNVTRFNARITRREKEEKKIEERKRRSEKQKETTDASIFVRIFNRRERNIYHRYLIGKVVG